MAGIAVFVGGVEPAAQVLHELLPLELDQLDLADLALFGGNRAVRRDGDRARVLRHRHRAVLLVQDRQAAGIDDLAVEVELEVAGPGVALAVAGFDRHVAVAVKGDVERVVGAR